MCDQISETMNIQSPEGMNILGSHGNYDCKKILGSQWICLPVILINFMFLYKDCSIDEQA
jgi:hypothetical protein